MAKALESASAEAPVLGFEPRFRGSKPRVLPLHHSGMNRRISTPGGLEAAARARLAVPGWLTYLAVR